MKPGIVLASGGIDSTVLMYHLHQKKALKGIFFVNYEQASASIQYSNLMYHSKILKVPFEMFSLYLPLYMRGSGAILKGKPKKKQKKPYENLHYGAKKNKEWLRDVYDYIPARNTLFTLYALGWARSLGLKMVYAGYQLDSEVWEAFHKAGVDSSPGMDTTPGYVRDFNLFLKSGAIDNDMRVEAPFLDDCMDKQEVVKWGKKYKVDLSKTYSCEFYPECGACQGCLVRRKVLTGQGESVG